MQDAPERTNKTETRTERDTPRAQSRLRSVLKYRLAVYESATDECKGSLGLFLRKLYRDHFEGNSRS